MHSLGKEIMMKKSIDRSVMAVFFFFLLLLLFLLPSGKISANEEDPVEIGEVSDGQGPYTPDANTIALWHFDGGGQDAGPNGYNLYVYEDRIDWVSGYYGGAILMNAPVPEPANCSPADPAIIVPGYGTTYYSGTGDMTIEAWVKYDSTAKEYIIFANDPEPWGTRVPYSLSIISGTARFHIEDAYNGWADLDVPVADKVSTWFHIAATYTYHSKMQLWINGMSKGKKSTTIIPASLPGPDNNVHIGGTNCVTSNGLTLDELRISNIARKYRGKRSLVSEIEE
jgi:hypothetical protein